jgi:glucose-6-phosphate 1-dehydrogenase
MTHAKPVIFILFGATGDLSVKKIVPALARLHSTGAIGLCRIIGVGRRDWKTSDFLTFLKSSGTPFAEDFERRISYAKVDIESGRGYETLAADVEEAKKDMPGAETMVHLSLAPGFHGKVASALVSSKILAKGKGKLLIEKPFGTDEKTAKALDKLLGSKLREDQIYRIDHYLGKETVIAMMDLHERTPDFGAMITTKSVEYIRARLTETKGIEGRGESYESVGAFRDVGQNHLLELIAVAGAEIKKGESWQDARADVIVKLAPPAKTCDLSRRGQYAGYFEERGVGSGSDTETAFEIVTNLRSGKLKGVPLILESGKKMKKAESFVEIVFKDPTIDPKRIFFSIQPEQSIDIEYRDGTSDSFEVPKRRDAYDNVILAALSGDKRLFVGKDEIEALWSYADHVVACWDKVPLDVYSEKKPFKFDSFLK